MSERIDKAWANKGLSSYSTEAIVGTLGHYGVVVDEAGFKALADGEAPSPMAIARRWMEGWKATGPFARLPLPAAEALWSRWLPERPIPFQLAQALASLLNALGRQQQEKGDFEAVAQGLTEVESLVARAPRTGEGVEPAFVAEAFGRLPEQAGWAFDAGTQELVRREQLPLAERWAKVEEALYPERVGLATAPIEVVTGDRAEVLARLAAAGAPTESEGRRMLALDTLAQLQAWAEARTVGEPLLDHAEKGDDFHLALAVCERLGAALQELGDTAAFRALEQRRARIDAAHRHAHPGHHH